MPSKRAGAQRLQRYSKHQYSEPVALLVVEMSGLDTNMPENRRYVYKIFNLSTTEGSTVRLLGLSGCNPINYCSATRYSAKLFFNVSASIV
jgi:hypothetical protein